MRSLRSFLTFWMVLGLAWFPLAGCTETSRTTRTVEYDDDDWDDDADYEVEVETVHRDHPGDYEIDVDDTEIEIDD